MSIDMHRCDECSNVYSKDNPRVNVQYLTGEYYSCEPCVERKMDEGLIVKLTQSFVIAGRRYMKGYVGIGVLDHIKRVYEGHQRDAS